jgi:hypothetical protein
MIDSVMEVFDDQRDRFLAGSSEVKYLHPTLPIGIIESQLLDCLHHSHQIRILNVEDASPLKDKDLISILRKVLRHVDLFHCYLISALEKSGKLISNTGDRRKSMLMWLIESLIKPTDGLPIHGLVPITSGRQPYNQLFEKTSLNLFGPAQRDILSFFSKIQKDAKRSAVEEERAYLVITWYAHHFPNEIKSLFYPKSTVTKN